MPPGRPPILDDVKRREILALIAAGSRIELAAPLVGCSVRTILREARRNPDFGRKLRDARLGSRLIALNTMRQAAATHWRAAAWLLERTQPEQFSRRHVRSIDPPELDGIFDEFYRALGKAIPDGPKAALVINQVCHHMRRYMAQRSSYSKVKAPDRLVHVPRPSLNSALDSQDPLGRLPNLIPQSAPDNSPAAGSTSPLDASHSATQTRHNAVINAPLPTSIADVLSPPPNTVAPIFPIRIPDLDDTIPEFRH